MLTPEQIRKEVDEYLDWTLKQRPLAERSIQTYKRNVRTFLEEIQMPPEDIEPEDVLEWRKDRLDRGYNVSSVNSILTCVRDYWKYLMKTERIDRLTYFELKDIQHIKGEQPLPNVITPGQVADIFAAIDTTKQTGYRDAVVLFLLYRAALRVHEVTNLNVEDISDDYSTIRVINGKGGLSQVVPIDGNSFKRCLKKWVEEIRPIFAHPEENALIVATRYKGQGRRMDSRNVRASVKRLAERAGLPSWVSCHTFRHSRATHLLDAGVDIMKIKTLLRHKSLSSTQIYTRTSVKSLERALQENPAPEEPLEMFNGIPKGRQPKRDLRSKEE